MKKFLKKEKSSSSIKSVLKDVNWPPLPPYIKNQSEEDRIKWRKEVDKRIQIAYKLLREKARREE